MRLFNRLVLIATVLAFAVIALGAYVRLSDAGLGCPDWPGCYGHWLGIPEAAHEQLAAQQSYPGRPIESAKAWKEMIHRYFAGTLGLLILALCLLAWRAELRRQQSPALPSALLGIVSLQAALGMWTVTLQLKPLIVTLHLLGGMTTLALLLALKPQKPPARQLASGLRLPTAIALLAVIIQIALGGWVSSNYAALACSDFPLCQTHLVPNMDFAQAFSLQRELGQTADGKLLSFAALTAIHWSHRLGALAVILSVGTLALALFRSGENAWGRLLLALLAVQVSLGISNILFSLPLALALAHNLGAACLLSVTLSLNLRLHQAPASAASCNAAASESMKCGNGSCSCSSGPVDSMSWTLHDG